MNTSTLPNPTLPVDDQMVKERREELLCRINADKRLPSLGVALSDVIKITSTGEESVNKLAKFILADVGLTKDILNLANSVSYRSAQGRPVTTVSKAIFILGFDVVKTSALGMLMLDCFNDKDQCLYYELTQSLCASIIARECVSRSLYRDSEEASISAMFKNMGQLLIAAEAPELYREIMRPVKAGTMSLHASAVAQLGCSFSYFGTLVLKRWNMPESIVQAVSELSSGEIKKTKNRRDWVRQVAAFGSEAAEILMQKARENGNVENETHSHELIKRYGVALELDSKSLPNWLISAVKETEQMTLKLGIRTEEVIKPVPETPQEELAKQTLQLETTLTDDLLMSWESEEVVDDTSLYPSGKPYNARELLLSGLMEITQTISGGKYKLNDLFLQMLEILQGSLGFQFATASLKDTKSERYVGRISIGQDWYKKQQNFNFSSREAVDLFHLAIKKNVDLVISDTANAKIHHLRPKWHQEYFPDVKSMMILPLIVSGKSIGLIYADRDREAPEGILPEETALIKTMMGQLAAVMGR